MNAERFSFYIKNPAHLYQITYTELKNMVLQYPYCQNLRYLLLKKSILDKHQERDQHLQLAATYSIDRSFLYQQIKEGDSYLSEADSFLLKEDYLELKELNPGSDDAKVIVNPAVELETKPGDSVSDNNVTLSKKASEVVIAVLPEEEAIPEPGPFTYLEEIDEEELVDITDEMEEVFVVDAIGDLEYKTDAAFEEDDQETSHLDKIEKEEVPKDIAISIEELIELDSLSPLERWEKSNPVPKKRKKEKKEDQKPGMKKENTDFEEMDTLIEKTKKNVPLEITNKDIVSTEEEKAPKPSPKASFSSWLSQFQSKEEKVEKEATFEIPESKKEVAKPKKEAKKTKKQGKAKKRKVVKDSVPKKKGKKMTKVPGDVNEDIPEKPKKIAEKSLAPNASIVSETLAKLLAKQENYEEAIKMYDKLSLIFPEKSAYFADQIKKLKNL